MSVGTDASGGFLVPTFLDPSIILSSAGSTNPFREAARVVQTTGKQWDGVTSAGVTASFDAEAAEVSDDAPTLVQPSIDVHKAQCFVPASIEIIQDAPGLEQELARLFADAKNTLEADMFHDGSGSGQPEGVITGLSSGANYTSMATNSAFAVADLFTAAEALPARFRGPAAWMLDQVLLFDVMEFGGTNYYTRSGDLASGPAPTILGKRAYECSQFSSTLSTATNDNIVYGDWDGYVIADRVGAAVEFIPHTSRPATTGRTASAVSTTTGESAPKS